jgi:hypothetical protein
MTGKPINLLPNSESTDFPTSTVSRSQSVQKRRIILSNDGSIGRAICGVMAKDDDLPEACAGGPGRDVGSGNCQGISTAMVLIGPQFYLVKQLSGIDTVLHLSRSGLVATTWLQRGYNAAISRWSLVTPDDEAVTSTTLRWDYYPSNG